LLFAALATTLAVGWTYLTVRYNYQGNWSALFMTGGNLGSPAGADFQGTYVFVGSNGYDGQFYRAVAHDPGLQRGLLLDAPRLRYRRILLPAMAWLLALGNPRRIDAAYIAAVFGFVFLGAYGIARWAVLHGRSASWGLGFLALPATIVSAARMTPDVALAALCSLWALFPEQAKTWKPYSLLVVMPFVRETGLLLNAAAAICEARAREFHRAGLVLATVIPYAVWWIVVSMRTQPDPTNWFQYVPGAGILTALWRGPSERADLPAREIVMALDYMALCGIALGTGLAVYLWQRDRNDKLALAALLFALLTVATGRDDVWAHVFAFGRVFSPLLLLLGMRAVAGRQLLLLAPVLLTLPRVLTELAPLSLGILRGLSQQRAG
jgi:hypothetical protein